MPTIFARLGSAILAWFSALLISPQAAIANEILPPLDPGQVEAMCPVGGSPTRLAGQLGQRLTLEERFGQIKAAPTPPPFNKVEVNLTAWSERFAALTYRASLAEGTSPVAWRTALESGLLTQGWQRVLRPELRATDMIESSQFLKPVGTGAGRRQMLLEIDTPGLLLLRCGDLALLQIDADERDGRLEPGSPRPRASAISPAALPEPADCERPGWRAAFADISSPDQIGAAFETVMPGLAFGPGALGEARRLQQWLRWKLREAGGLSEDQVLAIEDQVGPLPGESIMLMEQSMEAMGGVFAAQERGDGVAACQALVRFFVKSQESDARQAIWVQRVNAALEAEAVRRRLAPD